MSTLREQVAREIRHSGLLREEPRPEDYLMADRILAFTEADAREQLSLAVVDAGHMEAEVNDLRATFDRTVAAWKREELSWDEERLELTEKRDRLQHIIDCANTPLMRDVLAERDEALRDVQQLHDAAVETEGKLEELAALRLENERLRGIATELVDRIASGRPLSIGAVHNTLEVRYGVEEVERYRAALTPSPGLLDGVPPLPMRRKP